MKYIYEFIGAFFLVFTVGMTVMDPHNAGLLAPLAIGSALAIMVFAGGHVSGGHYNPAVSLAVYIRGKLHTKDLILYWIAQFIGAVAAACLTIYFKDGPSAPMTGFEPAKAFIAELVFTFALCYVVLNVATSQKTKGNSYFGWAIGFTVVVGAYAVGAVSGGAFNPAVALGMTMMNITLWPSIWIFFLANLLGGICAALVFKIAHPKE